MAVARCPAKLVSRHDGPAPTIITRGNMRISTWLAPLALLLSIGATPAAAQHTQTRNGFWFGAGLGYGSLGCDGCAGDRTGGSSGYIKLGGTLNQHLLLGVETNGWYKSESGTTLTQGNVSGAAYWYPSATSGLFLKGGVGYAVLNADTFYGSGSTNGWGAIAGLGYDLRVGSNTSITPTANWFRGDFANGSTDVFQFGLGLTLH
jgi:hypothetical protein